MESNLPEGWTIAKISEVAFTASGGTPSTTKREYWDNGKVPWINSGMLKDNLISAPSHFITELGLKNSSAKLFPKNTVVIALTGANVGKVGILNFECSANQSVTGLYPSNNTNAKYLFYFLLSARSSIVSMAIGSAQPHINKGIVDNLHVPIAPLAEQRRIVAKLDDLMKRIDRTRSRLERIPELIKRFRQSILFAAISGKLTEEWRVQYLNEEKDDSLDFPISWLEKRLGEISKVVTSGSRGWAKYYSKEGSLFVRAQNINTDVLKLDDVAYVKIPNRTEGLRTKIQKDDILITITGANVTKAAIVERDLKEAYVSQHVGLVRLKDVGYSKFIYYSIVSSAHGRKQLLGAAYGQGKPQLNLDNIKSVIIFLPSKEEANEIVQKIDKLFALAEKLEARYLKAKIQLDKLPQSLLAKAFRGELVPQDENDEPASELLNHINSSSNSKERKGKLSLDTFVDI